MKTFMEVYIYFRGSKNTFVELNSYFHGIKRKHTNIVVDLEDPTKEMGAGRVTGDTSKPRRTRKQTADSVARHQANYRVCIVEVVTPTD